MGDMAAAITRQLIDTKPAIKRRHLLLKIVKPSGQLGA
jgi:hypothetical protein